MNSSQNNLLQSAFMRNEGLAAGLLAGGRSTRMGQDKAVMRYGGEGLWQKQLSLLHEAGFSPLLVSCRSEQGFADAAAQWAALRGVTVQMVFDPPDGSAEPRGPLAAVVRCLERVDQPLLVLAVDMPQVSRDFLHCLIAAQAKAEGGLVVSHQGQIEPMISIWHPQSVDRLKEAMKQPQQPSLRGLLELEVASGRAERWEVPPGMEACLANWNYPTDVTSASGLTS